MDEQRQGRGQVAAREDDMLREHRAMVLRHARSVARRWSGQIEVDDLVSVGMLALLNAVRSFDPARRVPWDLYAGRHVRWAMVSEARSRSTIRRGGMERRRALRAAHERLEQRYAHTPTADVLAEELGITVDDLARWEREAVRAEHVDLTDIVEPLATGTQGPEDRLLEAELVACLRRALAALPARLASVVQDSFVDELPLHVIAARLGVTESRVSQMRGEAVALLADGLQLQLGIDVDEEHLSRRLSPRRRDAFRRALLTTTGFGVNT